MNSKRLWSGALAAVLGVSMAPLGFAQYTQDTWNQNRNRTQNQSQFQRGARDMSPRNTTDSRNTEAADRYRGDSDTEFRGETDFRYQEDRTRGMTQDRYRGDRYRDQDTYRDTDSFRGRVETDERLRGRDAFRDDRFRGGSITTEGQFGTERFGEDRSGRTYRDTTGSQMRTGRQQDSKGVVADVNRAQKLIGMNVKNQQGQTLGEIHDVVFDFDNGRLSYVVLETGGILGMGDKLVAVPIHAFSRGEQGNQLVLNVNRDRLQRAPGLSDANWPDANNPSWGAGRFWYQERPGMDRGANIRQDRFNQPRYDQDRFDRSDRSEYRQDRFDTDLRTDRDQVRMQGRFDADLDGDRYQEEYRTERYRGGRTTTEFEENGDLQRFKGEIAAVDPDNRTLTVRNDQGQTRTFRLDNRPNLTVLNNRNPSLVDFKVGYPVSIGFYRNSDGSLIAQSVIHTTATEVR